MNTLSLLQGAFRVGLLTAAGRAEAKPVAISRAIRDSVRVFETKFRSNVTGTPFRKGVARPRALSEERRGICRSIVVALLLVVWLATFALTASPRLHQLLHPDAKSSTHNCLVAQLLQQSLLTGSTTISAPTWNSYGVGSDYDDVQIFPSVDYLLSPSRAPPL